MAGFVTFENNIATCRKAGEIADSRLFSSLGLLLVLVGWSDSNLTDGFISRRNWSAATLGLTCDKERSELLKSGFLESVSGGWQIHDYTDWQRSAAEIRARSESARRAARERWSNANSNAKRNAKRNALGNATPAKPHHAEEREEREEKTPPIPPAGLKQLAAIIEKEAGVILSSKTQIKLQTLLDSYGSEEAEKRLRFGLADTPKLDLALHRAQNATAAELSKPDPAEVPLRDLIGFDL